MPRHSPCALISLISSKLTQQFPHFRNVFTSRQCYPASLFVLSNQNPLALGFWFVILNKEQSFALLFWIQFTIRDFWFSIVELCRQSTGYFSQNCNCYPHLYTKDVPQLKFTTFSNLSIWKTFCCLAFITFQYIVQFSRCKFQSLRLDANTWILSDPCI